MSEYNNKDMIVSEKSSQEGHLDLNARRRAALAEVDNAAFGWFHVKVSYTACRGTPGA